VNNFFFFFFLVCVCVVELRTLSFALLFEPHLQFVYIWLFFEIEFCLGPSGLSSPCFRFPDVAGMTGMSHQAQLFFFSVEIGSHNLFFFFALGLA
jgi:hypothetical protein